MRLEKLNPGTVVLAHPQSLSKAIHDGKYLIMKQTAGILITLPKSTGSGATFRLYLAVATSSGGCTIKVIDSVDVILGNVVTIGATTAGFITAVDTDTIIMNRTTSGGNAAGEWIELIDMLPGVWSVTGVLNAASTPTTPFSATV